jgi:GT2 family glycosyltransferase
MTNFLHQEEIDLCWRALNKGYKIKYISESVVYHVGGTTLKSKKTFFEFQKSIDVDKNLPENKLSNSFRQNGLDGIAGMQFLVTRIQTFCSNIKSSFFFYKLF